jgi:hypothetical protein
MFRDDLNRQDVARLFLSLYSMLQEQLILAFNNTTAKYGNSRVDHERNHCSKPLCHLKRLPCLEWSTLNAIPPSQYAILLRYHCAAP